MTFFIAHQALIREFINGVACVLFLTLTIMVAVYMWDTWVMWSTPNQRWQDALGVPTACVMFWVFGAESYRTFQVWYSYNLGRAAPDMMGSPGVGIFSSGTGWSSVTYLVAGLVLCCGLLRGIYLFTPPDWKRRVWKLSLAAALVFISLPTILRILVDAQ